MGLHFFIDRRMDYLNDRTMEKKKVVVELEVLTGRMTSRDIEHDLDRVLLPLKSIESGDTTINDINMVCVR